MSVLTGCRTNNGEIGLFYGQWVLEDMSCDGEKVSLDEADYFWSFQNNIIFIDKVSEYQQFFNTMGTWDEEDNVLYLNFSHKYGGIEGSENWRDFVPPPELMIPGNAITPMDILSMTSKEMTLSYIDDQGQTLVYHLQKLR